MDRDTGGFRGYISSRPVRETRFPQRVQNLIIRSYAQRHCLPFKLSLAEYAMPGCYMMLRTLLDELPRLDGVIFFSMFMLPDRRKQRDPVYERVLESGAELHAALEDIVLQSRHDVARFEDTLQVAHALQATPLRGRFGKANDSYSPSDPFVVALKAAFEPI